MSFQKVSEYITDFISKHGDSNIQTKWNPNEFKKIFNKKEKSSVKKNKSAYMFFSDEERQNIKKEGLTLNNKQIVSELGSRWTVFKEKNPAGVEKFNKMAEEDKVRYTQDLDVLGDKDEKPSKKKKEVSSLKKNKSAYMFFCIEDRENLKKEGLVLNNKEVITEMANRWKKLKEDNPAKLEKFNKLAVQDKERYTNEKTHSGSAVKEEIVVVAEPPVVEVPVPTPAPVVAKKAKRTKK